MKKMKRFSAFLVCCLVLLGLVACEKKTERGWIFKVGNTELEVGAVCADAIKALKNDCTGEKASGSCWKDAGEDVVYTYEGFRIKTYRKTEGDSGETLLAVEFTSDAVKTPEGVTVGSTADSVKSAYGTPSSEDDSTICYDKGNARLRFDIRDGKVTGVSYLAIDYSKQ